MNFLQITLILYLLFSLPTQKVTAVATWIGVYCTVVDITAGESDWGMNKLSPLLPSVRLIIGEGIIPAIEGI